MNGQLQAGDEMDHHCPSSLARRATFLNWILEVVAAFSRTYTPFFHSPMYSAWPIFSLPSPSNCPFEK